ncbi:MAG: flavodoxin family protein [Phycisphaerae bacterium]|nr:flavodoxin family protein [Phycisphaerae bacterium]
MKILGICCSPRKGQTTFKAMEVCLAAAREVDERIDTELIELADKRIAPCIACNICKEGLICGIDDDFSELIPLLADKDVAGVIIGTPVYFGSMTAQCKALLDRCVVFRRNDWLLRDKVGGVLAVGGVRHGGQELTLQTVRAAMLCHDMICVGDGQPSGHFGAALYSGGEDGIETDEAGLETARNLGRRVAKVTLKLNGTNRATS